MPLPDWVDLPPLDRYTSRLPEAYPGAPETPTGIPVDWAQRSIEAATMLAGHLTQNIALGGGWTAPLAELDALVSLAKRVAQGGDDPLAILDAVRKLMRESNLLRTALEAPLAEVQKVVVSALSAAIGAATIAVELVPVVGWAVMAIRFFVQAQRIRTSDATFGVSDLLDGYNWAETPHFERDRDDDEANRMLDVLAGGDWTSVWMPSTAPWDKRALTFSGAKKLEGWVFGAGVGGLHQDNFSCVPGMAQIGAQYYGAIDWAIGYKPGTIVPVRSTSDIWPSLLMLSGLAWARLWVPSGQMCNVDLRAVESAWAVWQGRGRQWLETQAMRPPVDRPDEYQIPALRTMAWGALGGRYDDGGRPIRTDLYPGANLRAGSGKTVRDRVAEACHALRERIFANLGTIACAYVPPEAPALRDVNLKVRYAAMRVKLLEHPARFDVELARVPDAAYRAMLHEATVGQTLGAPGVRPRGQTLDGQSSPRAPRLPDVPDASGETAGGSGAGLALIAGGALAAVLVARGRR